MLCPGLLAPRVLIDISFRRRHTSRTSHLTSATRPLVTAHHLGRRIRALETTTPLWPLRSGSVSAATPTPSPLCCCRSASAVLPSAPRPASPVAHVRSSAPRRFRSPQPHRPRHREFWLAAPGARSPRLGG